MKSWHGLLRARVAGLRLGLMGSYPVSAFGGIGAAVNVAPDWTNSLSEKMNGWLDIMVVGADPVGWETDQIRSIVREARAMGARVVAITDDGETPSWYEAGDLLAGTTPSKANGGLVLQAAVDMHTVNPSEYRRVENGKIPAVEVDGRSPGLVAAELNKCAAVRVSGVSGQIDRLASWLVTLTGTGLPVVCPDLTNEAANLIGPELAALVRNVDAAHLADSHDRDRISVQMRQAAMRHRSTSQLCVALANRLAIPVGDLPSVSIIMATRRPEFLARAIEQVNRQSYQPTELVLVLRDSAFPSSAEQQARELAGPPLTVIRASDELSLGEALNEGLAVSTGELITKMDDDDWYGVDHLWDLVLGLEYSGAEVIGKAAEFVYLEDLDLTVRRKIKGAEEAAPTVAGGAFMIPRHILRMFGGWPHLSVGEDFHLMSQIRSAGGTVYRTHGFGYILNRHSHGNTWQVDSSAFVKGARYQWPGLNKDQAGV